MPRLFENIIFIKNYLLGALRYQFRIYEIALYNIDGLQSLNSFGFTISSYTLNKIRKHFHSHDAPELLKSRSHFINWCKQHDIRCPTSYGIIQKKSDLSTLKAQIQSVEKMIKTARPNQLVVKITGQSHGDGCYFIDKIDYRGEEIYVKERSGDLVPLRTFLTDCLYISEGDVTVDEYLAQHSVLKQFHPGSLNTVRVVTFLNSDGEVEIDGAVFRIGKKGLPVDSWRYGGIAAGIDLKSGKLGRGVKIGDRRGGSWYKIHPDSGIGIEGTALPMWNEVLSLAEKAALCRPDARWIGWDIAITKQPVLIEGNIGWALPFMLVHSGGRCPASWKKRLSDPDLPIPRDYLSGARYFIEKIIKKQSFK